MTSLGLDIGSLSTKGVILRDGTIVSRAIELTSGDNRKTVEWVVTQALEMAGLSRNDLDVIVATGYGRDNVPFASRKATEITCHALGAFFLLPDVKTIIDIGGQDSKAIKLGNEGKVIDFVMNDKCAAGTGRFLEVMAHALGVNLEELADLSSKSSVARPISSMCAVFAESEVVSLVAEGCDRSDIVCGVHEAIAERTISLLKRVSIEEPVAMTGGVAKNGGVVTALERKLNLTINIPHDPQVVGALGAALIGTRSHAASRREVA